MPACTTVQTPMPPPPVQYTVFTRNQKKFLVLLLSLANLASPLTATVYLPLLPLLQTRFRVSLLTINLTLTLYTVFQTMTPIVLFAPASDTLSLKSIILTTFSLYIIASVELILNRRSYVNFISIRALQSLDASAVQTVSYGIIAMSEAGRKRQDARTNYQYKQPWGEP